MIALYSRVSTQEQALEGYSIDGQIERMKSYCNAMDWTDCKIYTDAGFSGANTDRPALQSMIRDVENGSINKVLVYKLDRLSRSQLDTIYLIEKIFLSNDCDFVSLSENFDTSTPFGRATIGILAVFAQLEREQIKERMMLGKAVKAKSGDYIGIGTAPIGYDYIDGKLQINEYERLIVIEAFELALKGYSIYKICRMFESAGYRHKNSIIWQDRTIRNMLKNKTYIGMVNFGDIWYQGNHEPIIDPDTFDRVQILQDKRRTGIGGKHSYYLSGFIYCKRCGAHYAANVSKQKRPNGSIYEYKRFSCNSRTGRTKYLIKDPNCKNKHWKIDELTNAVFDEIRKLKFDSSYIQDVKETTQNDKISVLEHEITNVTDRINKLIDLYSFNSVPADVLETKIKQLNKQRDDLQNQLNTLSNNAKNRLSLNETIKLVNSFDDIFKRGNFDEIRAVIAALINRIEIDGNDIYIHWNF